MLSSKCLSKDWHCFDISCSLKIYKLLTTMCRIINVLNNIMNVMALYNFFLWISS
ncbi:hypothetical protein Sjap_021458 [Stephania japonica]|uniref:Uncharacterized protein n=1 Tax=Stephania japonica TaxID=461633 RepID=A0AAP0EM07_9MAGN